MSASAGVWQCPAVRTRSGSTSVTEQVETTVWLDHTTNYSYDASGNKLATTDPLGHVTSDSYDRAGELLSETDPLGHAASYTYDASGNRLSKTDANGHTTSYSYDPLGRLSSVTAPDGGVTSYTYDAAGNKLTCTDANGHTTLYTYDTDNRQSSLTAPLGRVWTYAYDAAGNQTTVVDANGNATQTAGDGTTTRSYDADNRLTGIAYSDSTSAVSFTYDGIGNRLSMVDGSGTVSYSYDSSNRLTQVSRGSDSFSYGYNAAGELTSRTYPDGTVVTNSYDADSHLTSVASGGATTSYDYNAAGQLRTTTLPASNGYVETRSYDAAGRVIAVDNTNGVSALSAYAYTLDPVGNPTRIVRTGALNETATYSYDVNDRLTSVCYQDSCPNTTDPYIRYTYDGVGNRLTETTPSGTTGYSYNNADELTQAGSVAYSYDANGNELSVGGRTFSYDLANRLASTTSGGETTSYSYDGDGNRLSAAPAAGATNYLWDTNNPLPELALERDSSGSLLRRYVYGVRRIALNDGSDNSYYHYDRVGSVVNVTSQAGVTEWTYSYHPFGATRSEERGDPQAPLNPMKFAGQIADPSGLYYLRARNYDPLTGRFMGPDPFPVAAEDPSKSLYLYADDRPTSLVDPTGLRSVDVDDPWTPSYTIPTTPVPTVPSSEPDQSNAAKVPLRVVGPGEGGYMLVYPIGTGYSSHSSRVHPTAGLPGYPASDFFARAGAPVLAIQSGRIRKYSGHDPALGPTQGIHGPFGWSIYLAADTGSDFYYTHLGTRTAALGSRVAIGQVIGTVGNYVRWGGVNHTHIGVHGGPVTIETVRAAPRFG